LALIQKLDKEIGRKFTEEVYLEQGKIILFSYLNVGYKSSMD